VITLAERTISRLEVRLEVAFKEVAGDTLNGIVEGQDVNSFGIRNFTSGADSDDVTELDAKIFTNHLIHANLVEGGGKREEEKKKREGKKKNQRRTKPTWS
jgi:hypothetical protein